MIDGMFGTIGHKATFELLGHKTNVEELQEVQGMEKKCHRKLRMNTSKHNLALALVHRTHV